MLSNAKGCTAVPARRAGKKAPKRHLRRIVCWAIIRRVASDERRSALVRALQIARFEKHLYPVELLSLARFRLNGLERRRGEGGKWRPEGSNGRTGRSELQRGSAPDVRRPSLHTKSPPAEIGYKMAAVVRGQTTHAAADGLTRARARGPRGVEAQIRMGSEGHACCA